MPTGRHAELLQWLRGRGPTTVREAARAFEVSERTVLRDIQRLRADGYIVRSSQGRGGGIELDPGARLPPVAFSVEEVLAVVVGMAMAGHAGVPFRSHADAALRRLRAALPPERARALRRLLRCVLIGEPQGGAPRPVSPTLLPAFERAFTERRTLRFRYRDRHGRRTRRHAEAHGLLVRAPLWYMLAWDVDKDAPRVFRMDRIASAEVTDRPFGPRAQLDLREALCPDAVELSGRPASRR